MKVVFESQKLDYLYVTPLQAIRGKQKYPSEVLKQYKKKIQILEALPKLDELRKMRGLNFEYLKGERKGECSIRLNDQYRLIFVPTEENTIQVLLIREISKQYE